MKDLSIKKLYYSISEVSKITDIEQYVLRYWETEFEQLKPQKNRAGNRIYTNKDIQLIMYIKELLRDKKYTIEGAKKILEDYTHGKSAHPGREQRDRRQKSGEHHEQEADAVDAHEIIDTEPRNPRVPLDKLEIG